MFRVKRTKAGIVTYATAVAPSGTIASLSRDPAQAVAVTEGVVRRVREYYRGKLNVGDLTFEPVDANAAQLADAVAAEDAVGAAEFAKLQAEVKRLKDANAALEQRAGEESLVAASEKRRADEQSQRVKDLESQLIVKGEEVGTLKARLMDAEAELAAKPKQQTPTPAPVQPTQPTGKPNKNK